MLLVALTLGLGWAVRGHFGHEWGAAWAGALAGAAVLVAGNRADWARSLPVLVALCAIGWGVGGMMSYGRIVGFGRADDFGNVWYGLTMLGVVGGLYGFIGGGLFGLGLETTREQRPAWASLLAEMVAGAWLAWGWLVYQLQWLMTPPRSELWAACLGAAVALAWFLHRNGYHRALRVAGYAALGAGFGFAFGNFIQTLGRVSGIGFNWWNVMEFSLGFFGGLGLAYGVFTRDWPETFDRGRVANGLGLLTVLLAIPATNLIKQFGVEDFRELALQRGVANPDAFAALHISTGWALLLVVLGLGWAGWSAWRASDDRLLGRYAPAVLFGLTVWYILASHLKKGVLAGVANQPEQLLYWVVLVVIAGLWWRQRTRTVTLPLASAPPETGRRWAAVLVGMVVLLALLAMIAIQLHDGLPGAQERF